MCLSKAGQQSIMYVERDDRNLLTNNLGVQTCDLGIWLSTLADYRPKPIAEPKSSARLMWAVTPYSIASVQYER